MGPYLPRAIPLAFLLSTACGGPIDEAPAVDDEADVRLSAFPTCERDAPTWSLEWLPSTPMEEHRFAGGGVAVADLDGDGELDLLLADAQGPRVLAGPDFDRTLDTPLPAGPLDAFTGIAVADIEGDGDVDVWWVRFGAPDVFWRNEGGRLVEEVTGVEGGDHHGQSAAWADLDGDGWLDLVVAGHGAVSAEDGQVRIDGPGDPTRVLRGGPEGLTDAPAPEGVFAEAYTFVASPIDLNDDGRLDLFAANDYPAWLPQQTAWNEPSGFRIDDGSTGLQPVAAGMGLGLGDVDLDGGTDLLLPVWDRVLFLESVGDGWVESAQARGLRIAPRSVRGGAWVGWGAQLADLDLDGSLDALVAFGHLDTLAPVTFGGADASNAARQGLRTWRGAPPVDGAPGGFTRTLLGLDTGFEVDDPHEGVHRGVVTVDVNDDGVLDVIAPDLGGGVAVFRSRCSARPSLVVELQQDGPNRDAVGARVVAQVEGEMVAEGTVRRGGTGLLSSGPATVHLGLPAGSEEVALELRWPDGEVELLDKVPVRHRVVVARTLTP